jgi:hypothetical protein
MDFMIVWSQMVLKSRFRFRIIPSLDVWAMDAFDLLIVGYLLELLYDGASVRATMMIWRPLSVEFQQVLPPSVESWSGDAVDVEELNVTADD